MDGSGSHSPQSVQDQSTLPADGEARNPPVGRPYCDFRNVKHSPKSHPPKHTGLTTVNHLMPTTKTISYFRSPNQYKKVLWLDGSRTSQLAPRRCSPLNIPGEYVDERSSPMVTFAGDFNSPYTDTVGAPSSGTETLVQPPVHQQSQSIFNHNANSKPTLPPLRIPPPDKANFDVGATLPAIPLISLTRRTTWSDESLQANSRGKRPKIHRRSHSDGSSLRFEQRSSGKGAKSVSRPSTNAETEVQGIGKYSVGSVDALTGNLEGLLADALDLAEDAAAHNKHNEASMILEQTANTLNSMSLVQEKQNMAVPRGMQPIRMSFSYTSSSSSYSSDRTSSSRSSESAAVDSNLRMYNQPATSIEDGGVFMGGARLSGGPKHNANGVKAVWNEGPPDPVVIDWAYENASPHRQRAWCAPEEVKIPYRRTIGTGIDPKILRGTVTTNDQVNLRRHVTPSNGPVQKSGYPSDQPITPSHRSSFRPRNQTDGEIAQSPRSATTEPTSPGANREEPSPISTMDHSPSGDKAMLNDKDYISRDALKRQHHITLGENQRFSVHHHRRQPIARNWSSRRKRFTAFVACVNTALVGILIGIYAGEVPAIQYALTDTEHYAILGNVVLYIGIAITTFLCWPLPLLHGRKPYILTALALALPLQFPQAVITMEQRDPDNTGYRTGLLLCRGLSGLALGLLHINCKPMLLDLFGASLQSSHPHGEVLVVEDIRRNGGGIGLWLGFWSFCFIGSLSLGFVIGADVISSLNVSWGFYIGVILIAFVLLLNVVTPETRRAPHRRTLQEVQLPNMNVARRVARGEIKMHVDGDGPKWWFEESFAGIYLQWKMLDQSGFFIMAMYLAWVYGEIVLIIVLLGNLLSTNYNWRPEYIGLGVLSIAIGAFLAIPDTKANIFSRSRKNPPRTDSMTFQPRLTWTSHLVRRAAFMTVLPIAGLAYTLASSGQQVHFIVPIIFAGVIAYFSNLAIAECHGLIMETYDTSDLQPGVNSKHRLQSLPSATRKRRTTYTSYPRVCAGLFASHALGFLFAAAATGVGGAVTRRIGAQKATGITAGVLFGFTILLTMCLWRYKSLQVIPNELFGSLKRESSASIESDDWRAVIIGNPSGKVRRMSLLELGSLSRWTEIRRLNRLLNRTTTQGLTPGWK